MPTSDASLASSKLQDEQLVALSWIVEDWDTLSYDKVPSVVRLRAARRDRRRCKAHVNGRGRSPAHSLRSPPWALQHAAAPAAKTTADEQGDDPDHRQDDRDDEQPMDDEADTERVVLLRLSTASYTSEWFRRLSVGGLVLMTSSTLCSATWRVHPLRSSPDQSSPDPNSARPDSSGVKRRVRLSCSMWS
jgi:hypothetical protein